MIEATPYKDRRWRNLRRQVLERDGHACQLRLANCRGRATTVDHARDWRDGGAWFDPENLRAACHSCNVSQRNTRVAARARAQRTGTPPPAPYDPGDFVITSRTWLTDEDIAKYGPPPAPGEPPRRVRRR